MKKRKGKAAGKKRGKGSRKRTGLSRARGNGKKDSFSGVTVVEL